YQTKDGSWIQLVCFDSDSFWLPFCKEVGRQDLAADSRFSTSQDRKENSRVLISILDEIFKTRTLAEWDKTLTSMGLIYQKAYSFMDIVGDAQAAANDFFVEAPHASGRPIKIVNSPGKFSQTPSSVRSGAPEFGQHTEEVLLELGYSKEAIADLKNRGITA
ncbi:MAG: CoA transferase, partial [Deltaproteobacteria bacterium]|nr:CoA transferase [Deltaproteobacteria bacterium]